MINGLQTLYTRDMANEHVVRFSDMLKNKTVKFVRRLQEPTRISIPGQHAIDIAVR